MGWAVDAVLVRRGARFSSVSAAAFLSFLVTAVCLWSAIAYFFSFQQLRSLGVVYFIVGGLLQPLLARLLYYGGITRLGVARADPLRRISPLFAIFVAVLFLGERPSSFVYGGTVLIVIGACFVLARKGEEREWRILDAAFPLGSAFVAAVSQNVRRTGLLILPNPLIGAAVTTSTSLIVLFIFVLFTGKIGLIRPHRASMPFFGITAFISAGSQFLAFIALNQGEVSVIAPILSMTPFFSVFLSAFFLRDLERVTSKIVMGVLLLVTGVTLITTR